MPEPQPASRVVGILGGMGPAATVDFYDKLIRATPASCDQDHLRVVIWADPTVPNRQEAQLTGGTDPTPWLEEGVARLISCGAQLLAAPCNTIHAYLSTILQDKDVEFISIIDATVAAVRTTQVTGPIGLLATDAALASGLYQKALASAAMNPVLPSKASQRTLMRLINSVKAGTTGPQERQQLSSLLDELRKEGASLVIAGCTEISVLLSGLDTQLEVVDPSEALAQETVRRARIQPA